jgi:hypothetical protein
MVELPGADARRTREHFGPVVSSYSRAQAIADGALVDVSQADGFRGCFLYPVALTRAAWAETVEAGGRWQECRADDSGETLVLCGNQSVPGRLHDVCWTLLCALRRRKDSRRAGAPDGLRFSVLVDVLGNGRHRHVDLFSVCGPGDSGEPVITIMLANED